jgi:hypothetical protein
MKGIMTGKTILHGVTYGPCVLSLAFLLLKLAGGIMWPWPWVCAPMLIWPVMVIALLMIALFAPSDVFIALRNRIVGWTGE